VRPIAEPTAAVSALLAGEVQLVTTAPADSVAMLTARPELAVKSANVPLTYNWNFNMKEKPFDDKRVRQALNYAVDREGYVKDILQGLGVAAKSVFGPSMAAYDASLKGYSYDLDKAKALLKEAGLEDGFSFKMQTAKGLGFDQVALYVKDQLAKLKINVDVELFETQTMSANAAKEGTKPGIGAIGWSWNCNPPFNFDRFFTSAFAPPNGVNFGFYSNPEVDKMLDQVARTIDREERLKLYRKLDALVTEDAAWLFLYHPIEPRIHTKKLTWVSANSNWYTLRSASLA
jgi:ABC-type transport system substrate-binding protein